MQRYSPVPNTHPCGYGCFDFSIIKDENNRDGMTFLSILQDKI